MESNIQSPLSKVVRDKRVNEILGRIQKALKNNQPLIIPNADVKYMSRKLQEGGIQGEKRLYNLARLILMNFSPNSEIQVDLLVWGRCTNPFHKDIIKDRFSLDRGFANITEKSHTEQTTKFNLECPKCKNKIPIIASFVQFFPLNSADREVLNFISTRIKSTSNLSYKIADMVFGIDRMFKQDKIYGRFSQDVVDVYGIKLIVSSKENISSIVKWFEKHDKLRILEAKDYVGKNQKASGFQAYKIILQYHRQLFEIQIQSRRMYNEELYNRETSHKTYKENQMAKRRLLGHEYIVLYEALNRLFQSPMDISDMDYIELGFGRRRH